MRMPSEFAERVREIQRQLPDDVEERVYLLCALLAVTVSMTDLRERDAIAMYRRTLRGTRGLLEMLGKRRERREQGKLDAQSLNQAAESTH